MAVSMEVQNTTLANPGSKMSKKYKGMLKKVVKIKNDNDTMRIKNGQKLQTY